MDALRRVDDDARTAAAQRLGVVGEGCGKAVALEALGAERMHQSAQLLQCGCGSPLESQDGVACLLVAGRERRQPYAGDFPTPVRYRHAFVLPFRAVVAPDNPQPSRVAF